MTTYRGSNRAIKMIQKDMDNVKEESAKAERIWLWAWLSTHRHCEHCHTFILDASECQSLENGERP